MFNSKFSEKAIEFSGGSDYFNRTKGYVIDDTPCGDVNSAIRYLIKLCDMSEREAESYCNRIIKEYRKTVDSTTARVGVYNG